MREFELFVFEKQAEGRAAGTIQNYREAFKRFEQFAQDKEGLPPPLELSQIDRGMVVRWKEWLGDRKSGHRNWSKNARSIWTRAFNVFLNYARERNWIAWEPPAAVATERGERPALSADTVSLLLHAVSREGSRHRVRNKALLLLMVGTGLRPGELAQLEVRDIDFQHGIVTVRPEISKAREYGARMLPLSPSARIALHEYVRFVRAVEESPYPNLFLNERGGPLELRAIQIMLKRLAKRAGLKNLTPRMFRHTFATQSLLHDVPLPYVQAMMGHKSLSTTSIYLNHSLIQKAVLKQGWSPAELG